MNPYGCRKINRELVVDGNVDKPEWRDAEAATLVETATGGRPVQSTTAKLLWNERFLYVAFDCEDDYIHATMTGFNDLIYQEEVVEIFIDDDNDLKSYVEIEINPLNACLHYEVHNHLDGRVLTYARTVQRIQSAVRRDEAGKRWTVEMAIPMDEFVTARNCPPQPGDEWRMNLYRIDRPKIGKPEFSAWSPTGEIQYHKPACFAPIRFLAE